MASLGKRTHWQIWRDVIFALFAREIKTGFNDKFGISWAVVQPVSFIFILSFIRGRLDAGETHGIPTFVFMAYGMLLFQTFLQTFTASFAAIKKNKALFAFRQVQPISAIIAASLFEILVKVFVSFGIFLIMFLIGIELKVSDPLSIIFNFIGLWLFAASFGLLFGLGALYVPELGKVQGLLTRPLFFISGIFFSLQDIPKEYWWLLDWNPILHAIELSRFSSYPSYGDAGVSSGFLFGVVLSFLFFSLACYQSIWKRAINR